MNWFELIFLLVSTYAVIAYMIIYSCIRYESLYTFCSRDNGNAVCAGLFWPVMIFILIGAGLISSADRARNTR